VEDVIVTVEKEENIFVFSFED